MNNLIIKKVNLRPILYNYREFQMITPNFDSLAIMNITFVKVKTQYKICGATTASIITFCYPNQKKSFGFKVRF